MSARLQPFIAALSFLFAFALAASTPLAAAVIRVPQDAPNIAAAIGRARNGDIIEVAAGTYAAPGNGFNISGGSRGFTLRAAAGADVRIDGQGNGPILRVNGPSTSRGRPLVIEGITFQNGFAPNATLAGGVTIDGAEVIFVGSNFVNNATALHATGGGAVRVIGGASATFIECTWTGNSSPRRGGAIEVFDSIVSIYRGLFRDNRVNLPGHLGDASGGAAFVVDSVFHVSESRFEGNQAGLAGGAIFAFGIWQAPFDQPRSDVFVINSTFEDNLVLADPCCPPPFPAVGGAIHAEDQVTLRVSGSRFFANRANQGGAIDLYRAEAMIHDSIFRANQALLDGPAIGAGGAIFATSPDFADSSTDFGAINRRPVSLTMTDSLLQGRFGGTAIAAHEGACLNIGGDINRAYGLGGVAAEGSLNSNRADVVLRNVVFADCDVQDRADGAGGVGGAIKAVLADLVMENSLIIDSDAMGAGSRGGALSLLDQSVATVTGSGIARNSAEQLGGALQVRGSEIDIASTLFIENEISPGVAEPIQQSNGAAIHSTPHTTADFTADAAGVIRDSTFIANIGVPLFEADQQTGSINALRYDNNEFFAPSFGGVVLINNQLGFAGFNVTQLNGLVVNRAGAANTDKSEIPNTALGSAPRIGQAVAAPASVQTALPPGDNAAAPAFLGYAWSGAGATLGGTALPDLTGLLEITTADDYDLRVNGNIADTATVAPDLCTAGGVACLRSNRFRVEIEWRDFAGRTGIGRAVQLTGDTGYFFFFDEENVEIVLKVLDGRPVNGNFWVFFGALSNVEFTIRVIDTQSGQLKTYFNPANNFASIGDTSAFPPAAMPIPADAPVVGAVALPASPTFAPKGGCVPDVNTLCLRDGRFQVTLNFRDFQGVPGIGEAVQLTNDTGYFFFFNEDNVEVTFKMLDGRPVNGNFWAFFAALTNVEFNLTVTDTQTGNMRVYSNPVNVFASVGDTAALPGSP